MSFQLCSPTVAIAVSSVCQLLALCPHFNVLVLISYLSLVHTMMSCVHHTVQNVLCTQCSVLIDLQHVFLSMMFCFHQSLVFCPLANVHQSIKPHPALVSFTILIIHSWHESSILNLLIPRTCSLRLGPVPNNLQHSVLTAVFCTRLVISILSSLQCAVLINLI